ncbi:MAG: DNA glycosylase AlkZ-like family protein, partial [Solirubrobacteraceae bacterium]
RDELAVFADERGRELFDLPDAPRPGAGVPAPPRFLPEFDNLVLAHDDRGRVIADEHRPLVTTKNLRVRATFLVDGVVAGTWKVELQRGVATLLVAPFGAVPARAVQPLTAEGEELLRFAEPEAKDHAVRIG